MSQKNKKLFLIDGHALAYRSYFAFINTNLRNSEGVPTGSLMGFANTLVKLLESEKPTHIAVAWDTHAPTFRHEMDAAYKANRPPQPDELRQTIPLMKEMVRHFGFQNLEKDGYEADDIIGTLAQRAGLDGAEVFMVTPDKDFMQLVTNNVRMYKPLNNGDGFQIIDPDGVVDYFGVPPEKVIDVLAVIGDTSDNIPGVPGIGKKGAPKLIKEYGSLEAAIEAAPGMKAKRAREGLTQHAEQALLSKKMIIIDTDVPDTVSWEELKWEGPESSELSDFFGRMEFRTLSRKFGKAMAEQGDGLQDEGVRKSASALRKDQQQGQGDLFGSGHQAAEASASESLKNLETEKANYRLIDTPEALDELINTLSASSHFCFDTETTASEPMLASLVGLAFSVRKKEAFYIPVNDAAGEAEGLSPELIQEKLTPVFGNSALKIAQNYKYDYIVLRRHGMALKGPVFDTMIAAYLIDSNQKLSMDELSRRYLNYEPVSIETLIGKGKQQKSMRDIPVDEVMPYACEDADITLQLFEVLQQKLNEDGLTEIAESVEFPLVRVLGELEMNGIQLDTEMLSNFSAQLGDDMKQLQQQIYAEAGEEFNINSPAQLGDILFEKLGLPSGKKTKTGKYSTNEQILTDLAAFGHKLPALVLDYRSLSKLKSTYADALPKLIHPETGRIHTSLNQQVAATGRLSSSNPNLQNIPVRTERGREIRKAFIAGEGKVLIAADYSQIELRVIASVSEDEAMVQAFRDDQDIHARTAMEIFGLSAITEVDRDMRRKAKEVNFGIPYGVSAFGLAQRLGIDRTEAKTIIDAYFERFPGIRNYIKETTAFAREHGYVTTLLGRRRYIPEIRSSNPNMRSFAERTAINMPIQGTAADLIKVAMVQLQARLERDLPECLMLLQVHDELLFEVPKDKAAESVQLIREEMEKAMTLKVPVKADAGVASNWLEAH
ncbi:DNA polymerase I [Cyclonatronum proteinivorum]|uniref:DNA polymerase I n=1 Tax=Cyclonatronum proteinivorum TaxID=1457365 RepID=A0A345UMN8_9BACT|nr:DNA polymerase I [Cyclonatronum proteinivorum]AXJ01740.1 DNA polymerase I [Cyclonatronum proteinivorum]